MAKDPQNIDFGILKSMSGPYAVRSSGWSEDRQESSLAGKFLTLLNIPFDEVTNAATKVYDSMGGEGSILIQTMIESEFSGVYFTQSFDNAASSELQYHYGPCSEIVSGTVQGTRVLLGRYSGKPVAAGKDLTPLEEKIFSQLFMIGFILEKRFGRPQDIEWTVDARTKKLVILQSRDITSFQFSRSITREQKRTLSSLIRRTLFFGKMPTATPIDLREICVNPCRFSADLILKIYEQQTDAALFFGKVFEFKMWLPRKKRFKISSTGDVEMAKSRMMETLTAIKDDPTESTKKKCERLFKLITELAFPLALECTRIASNPPRHSSNLKNKPTDVPLSKSLELIRDLSNLNDPQEFQRKWAHRGPDEYDFSKPLYGESITLVKQEAERYWGAQIKPNAELGIWELLKEETKDLSLRIFFELKLNLMQLAKELKIEPERLWQLTWNELRSNRQCSTSWQELQGIEPKNAISFYQVETLIFEEKSHPSHADPTVLVSVGSPVTVTGQLLTPEEWAKASPSESGTLLFLPDLSPKYASYLGRPGIVGLVALSGGRLSHLAILARETQIPAFVCSPSFTLHLGKIVTLQKDGKVISSTKG